MNIALGTYYAWSVFVPALEREFGWKRTQTSLVPTIDMVTLSLMFVFAGFLQKRIGPRVISLIGGILFSLGLFLASFIHSLPMLYLTWGLSWAPASALVIWRPSPSAPNGFPTTGAW